LDARLQSAIAGVGLLFAPFGCCQKQANNQALASVISYIVRHARQRDTFAKNRRPDHRNLDKTQVLIAMLI
jgi:hypothetical protein